MARVLIVEDSVILHKHLEELILEYTDFTYEIASTYKEAQLFLKTKKFEFAIVDLNLPDAKNGEIVSLVNKYDIAPIILTGDFSESMRESFESANIIDYVLKDSNHVFLYVIEKLRQLELNKNRKVLVVDDSSTYRAYLKSNLNIHNFHVLTAANGFEALEKLEQENDISIMISDYHMPKMDGLELVYNARSRYSSKDLSIIILTADRDPFTISRFLKAGANDYIAKPFSRDEFYSRLYQNIDTLDIFETITTQFDDNIIELLSEITEFKSSETSFHIKRIGKYTYTLAKLYGFEENEAKAMSKMSLLHDIGKVTIPDNILCKPEKLNTDEFQHIKLHTLNGYLLIKKAFANNLKMGALAMDITKHHHEKYDGSGYPDGLKENEIPLSAQIVSLVDVFDALANKRIYKSAWSLDDTIEYIKEQKSISFNPKLVDIFLDNIDSFTKILKKYNDDKN